MLANLASTILGIWLAFTAVLNPVLMSEGPFRIVATLAGIAIVILSAIARRTDYHVWHSNITTLLGAALIIVGVWNFADPLAPIVNYWVMFWVGLLVAFVALWAAVYKPEQAGWKP